MAVYNGSTTGLVGTLGVTVIDDATGAVAVARSTAGITEPVSGSAVYWHADPSIGQTLVWTETAGGYGAADPAAPDNTGIAEAAAAASLAAASADSADDKLPADTATKLAKLDAAVSTRAASTGMAGVDATTTGNLSVTRGTDATLTFDGDFTGTYSLTITPVGATTAALTKTGSWGSGEVQVTLSDTETTALTSGLYDYKMRVTEGSTTTLTHEGLVVVTS